MKGLTRWMPVGFASAPLPQGAFHAAANRFFGTSGRCGNIERLRDVLCAFRLQLSLHDRPLGATQSDERPRGFDV
jgi:hypothetical protein